MEKPLHEIHEILKSLVELHRLLLDVVKAEHQFLVEADLKNIQLILAKKQTTIEEIHQTENRRIRLITELALHWKRPVTELTMAALVRNSEEFRNIQEVMTLLMAQITEQNNQNKTLIEQSLRHIDVMKKNVLGEATKNSDTYTPNGQRANGPPESRLISREA